MKKTIYIIILIVLSSCLTHKAEKTNRDLQLHRKEKLEVIENTINEVETLVKNDNGNFWNHQLYGPLIFINPKTRVFVANKDNTSNDYKKVNSVFTDTLTKEINIANTSVNIDGEKWAMIMLPLPNDKFERTGLVIHELFHRLQPDIGFANLNEANNAHLDSYEGRLLLKFELEALKKALNSKNEILRNSHIANALFFRSKRQLNKQIKDNENLLELNEGLAEYTAVMLSGRNTKEMKLHFTNNINQFYTNPTFVRSFAYQTIPVYGYLLSQKVQSWQKNISNETNLTDYFINNFSIQLPKNNSYLKIAKENDYNYKDIVNEENLRENERLAKIKAYKKKFLEEPALKIQLENMNISFDPRTIIPLEKYGNVYPTARITDNWGILTIENGVLLSVDWKSVTVSKPLKISTEVVEGDGWTLELNKGWEVKNNNRIFQLKKK